MAEHSAQERTEAATPKRREDARRKGQVPRSRELATLTSLLGSATGMLVLGEHMLEDILAMLRKGLNFNIEQATEPAILTTQLAEMLIETLRIMAPFLALLFIVTLLTPMAMGGLVFSAGLLLPKAERINPLKGLGRIFSLQSMLELCKALIKFILVAGITAYVIYLVLPDILGLSLLPLEKAVSQSGQLLVFCFFGFSAVLILVAALDVPFQIWDHEQKLRMTRQEIKDEHKEQEGRPEVKSAIRNRQQEIARQRMMSELPKAAVVITNPVHYSVALAYDQQGSGAPKVVAKGRGHLALKIQEVARSHGVAVFPYPLLARALYVSTELDQEIPGNLFLAVAQVLAYIFQLRKSKGRSVRKLPRPPSHLPIPSEYEVLTRRLDSHDGKVGGQD